MHAGTSGSGSLRKREIWPTAPRAAVTAELILKDPASSQPLASNK